MRHFHIILLFDRPAVWCMHARTHARTHARPHAHTHERTHGTVKRYAFSDRHDAWLDTNDDHECIQLFTHELIRKCTGYPSF